jgi:putative molybdopterin biosynthesis protein
MILDNKSGIMATPGTDKKATSVEFENRLRQKRQSLGLSQKQLAEMAGITRQAVCAVETNQYSPATSVALQLARTLHCRVEDLFSLKTGGDIIEADLVGPIPAGTANVRAQVIQIGERLLVKPLDGLGELTSLSASADGLIVAPGSNNRRVKVKLLKDRDTMRRKVVVGGCDPAMFLAAAYLLKDKENLVPCLMGSGMAIGALKRGEVHVAGIHLADERSGDWNLPDLRRSLRGVDCLVVTFAHWEEGFIVKQGNPKKIRDATDLARPAVKLVNRERGSGARRLLDRQLKSFGIPPVRLRGYDDEALSHLDVASRIKAGLADVAIGVRAAAAICGLGFIPLQTERYDLVIPKAYYETLQGLRILLDTMVSKPFRDELEALGGYDTRDIGKILNMN